MLGVMELKYSEGNASLQVTEAEHEVSSTLYGVMEKDTAFMGTTNVRLPSSLPLTIPNR